MSSKTKVRHDGPLSGSLHEPIAIVGIGCRFPGGVNSPESFWQLLRDGVDAIGEIPANRFEIDAFYDPRPATPGKIISRYGGFLKNIDQFDAPFFGISPREAERLDPQQRLLLEVSWEAIEDSGIVPQTLEGSSTGVFVGMWINDFETRLLANPEPIDFYMTTGSGRYTASGRVSNFLGLQGPSLTLDTHCSSSLVAVYLGCQSLWSGECEMALVGGANVILSPHISIAYSQSNMLAPDGRCKFGDARANGYVRSEGAGMVVLKPLSRAVADRDPIYAKIIGGAVNNDGRTSGSMGTPGVRGQEDLLRKAYRTSGISPGKVQYVEAHGTGTRAGDPVELQALANVLKEGRPQDQPCVVGSVKTNIGHVEGAAGVAGLIKVALSLKHRALPGTLHFQTPNPGIPWESLPLVIYPDYRSWPGGSETAVAGVSSFGIAGTNAHIVLEEAPVQRAEGTQQILVTRQKDGKLGSQVHKEVTRTLHLLPLSAHTPDALKARAEDFKELLRNEGNQFDLADLCYTASPRRTHHEYRLAVAGHTRQEIIDQLEAFLHNEARPGMSSGRANPEAPQKVAFVFSGQGPQWWAMGRELLAQESVFREKIEQCDALLRRYASWSLMAELGADEKASRLDQTEIAQPALFGLQVALTSLWQSWGIRPNAVVGHSVGEVAAAHIAGALSLESALSVVFHRGRLMQQATGNGKMAEVELAAGETESLLIPFGERLSVAAINSPATTVLSGEPAALEAVLGQLEQRGIAFRRLPVNYAFHSQQMTPFESALASQLDGLTPESNAVAMASTVTGSLIRGEELTPTYWGRNIRQPVRFAAAIECLAEQGCNVFVEIGPHPVLAWHMEETLLRQGHQTVVLPSLRRQRPERATLLASLGALYVNGAGVNWNAVYPFHGGPVSLPSYPWQRQRFWLEVSKPPIGVTQNRSRSSAGLEHALLGTPLDVAALPASRVWEIAPDRRNQAFLFDHRLSGNPVLSASAVLELASAAGATQLKGTIELSDLEFRRTLYWPEGVEVIPVQFTLSPPEESHFHFSIDCLLKGAWLNHVKGRIGLSDSDGKTKSINLNSIRDFCTLEYDARLVYRQLRDLGLEIGPSLQNLGQLRFGDGQALAEVRLDQDTLTAQQPGLLTAVLDSCFQVAGALASLAPRKNKGDQLEGRVTDQALKMPYRLDTFRMSGKLDSHLWIYVCNRRESTEPGSLTQDIDLLNDSGETLAEIKGLCQRALSADALMASADEKKWLFELKWLPAAPRVTLSDSRKQETWLVFADKTGVGENFSSLISAKGHRPILAFAGDSFAVLGQDRFQVRVGRSEDLRQLLTVALGEKSPACQGIVHLWSLDAPLALETETGSLEAAMELGCESVLDLVQTLAHAEWEKRPRLWLVTSGSQSVTGPLHSLAGLAQSPLWGMGRVIGEEHPELWGGLVDLDPDDSADQAASLLSEDLLQPDRGDLSAFRAGRAYVAQLVHLENDKRESLPKLQLRSDCSYLITGGLGGVGLQVARWMSERGARWLIAIGRTPLPPRSDWDSVSVNEPAAYKIKAIRDLELVGVRVLYVAADVADEKQLNAFLQSYGSENWPPIRGVIHAAGITEDSLLINMQGASLRRVTRPKILGGWLLHSLLRDLDFFVLFSSIGSLVGLPGQGSYAAANAFLDGLAQCRFGMGRPAISINWSMWDGVGLAASSGGKRAKEYLAQEGIGSFAPEQGLGTLEALLGRHVPQVGVIPVISYRRIHQSPTMPERLSVRIFRQLGEQVESGRPGGLESIKAAPVSAAPRSVRDQLLAEKPKDRLSLLIHYLQSQLGRVLSMAPERIDPLKPMNSLGLTSLLALELRQRLEAGLGLKLSATVTFNYPTLARLAPFLAGRMDVTLEDSSTDKTGHVEPKPAHRQQPLDEEERYTSLSNVEQLTDEEALKALSRKN